MNPERAAERKVPHILFNTNYFIVTIEDLKNKSFNAIYFSIFLLLSAISCFRSRFVFNIYWCHRALILFYVTIIWHIALIKINHLILSTLLKYLRRSSKTLNKTYFNTYLPWLSLLARPKEHNDSNKQKYITAMIMRSSLLCENHLSFHDFMYLT